MKQLLLFFTLLLGFTAIAPQEIHAQAWSIKIDPEQDRDSMYIMLTDTVYSKYRHGKGKWFNLEQKRNYVTGWKEWCGYVTQSSTSAPTASVIMNTLGGTITWAYTSTGTYTGTLTGAFPAAKFVGSSGFIDVAASGDNTYSIQRGTDNTVVLKTYSDAGTTLANAMLSSIPIRLWVRN